MPSSRCRPPSPAAHQAAAALTTSEAAVTKATMTPIRRALSAAAWPLSRALQCRHDPINPLLGLGLGQPGSSLDQPGQISLSSADMEPCAMLAARMRAACGALVAGSSRDCGLSDRNSVSTAYSTGLLLLATVCAAPEPTASVAAATIVAPVLAALLATDAASIAPMTTPRAQTRIRGSRRAPQPHARWHRAAAAAIGRPNRRLR